MPPISTFLHNQGVAKEEMYRVFNMGIGYVFVVRPAFAKSIARILRRAGEQPMIIGRVKSGKGEVHLQ